MELMQIVSSLVSVEKITARKLEDTSVILKILEIKAQKIKNLKKKKSFQYLSVLGAEAEGLFFKSGCEASFS